MRAARTILRHFRSGHRAGPAKPPGTPTSRRRGASSAPSWIPRRTRRSVPRPPAGWRRTRRCWPNASHRDASVTATVTSRPRTSSASTTACASSTASSSPTSSATATCARTWPSSPWTSSAWGGPMRPSGSSVDYESRVGADLPRPLLHHYIAQRAYVRAKVACLQYEQGVEGCDHAARELHDLALRHARRSRQALVLVGGLPGHGQEHAGGRAGRRDRMGTPALGRGPPGAAASGGSGRRPMRALDAGATPPKPSAPSTRSSFAGPGPASRRASRSSSMLRGSTPARRARGGAGGRRHRERAAGALLHVRRLVAAARIDDAAPWRR